MRARIAAWFASRAAIRFSLAALPKRLLPSPMRAFLLRWFPAVSAAFAAAAAIGCSLTDRDWASNVIFSTGHHAQSHNQAALPALEDATRVVYMPGRDLRLLADEWLLEGLPADLPCAIVSRAAQPEQQIVHTTLGSLGETEPAAAPSLLIAGWAVRERGVAGCQVEETNYESAPGTLMA